MCSRDESLLSLREFQMDRIDFYARKEVSLHMLKKIIIWQLLSLTASYSAMLITFCIVELSDDQSCNYNKFWILSLRIIMLILDAQLSYCTNLTCIISWKFLKSFISTMLLLYFKDYSLYHYTQQTILEPIWSRTGFLLCSK